MKLIIQYVGYFMALVGALTVIWRVAISFQKGEDRDMITNKEIIEIRDEMITRTEWSILVDSISHHTARMEGSMNEIKTGLNALRNSYVSFVRNQKNLTTDQFLKYMEGIEFELKKKPESSSWLIPLRRDGS